jgi:DnaJ-class molecular chaperone
MIKDIKAPKESAVTFVRCPNCNGYGTKGYKRMRCPSCMGKGIIEVPAKEVPVKEKEEKDGL